MHVTQHVIHSYLDQRKYRHTTMVRHQEQVIVLSMDVAGCIRYAILDLQGNSGAHVLLAVHAQLEQMAPLNFPTAFVRVRDGAGRVTRLPAVANDPFLSSTARFTADAPFQVLSDDSDIFLFRQSRAGDHADIADNTLLLDRYEMMGNRLQLKTSDGSPEFTSVLDFIRHLHAGRFIVLLLPTADASTKRWQIFSYNDQSQYIDACNVKRSADGRFDTQVPPENDSPGAAPVEKRPIYLEAESALQFASDDTYVDCGAGIDLRGTDFTIELWVKRTALGAGPQFAIGHSDRKEGQHALHIGFRANNQFTFAFGADDAVSTQRRFRDMNWHHWACVYTHAERRRVMYYDGEQLNPKYNTAKAPYQGTGQFVIGKAPWGDGWRGHIDEVRVWRCARSAEAIQHDRSHRLVGDEADLVAYWRFDEGTGDTTRNQTANTHHGALHGNTNNAMWVTSSAPVRDHPCLDRRSFVLAGHTIASGLSAMLYTPQGGLQTGATPDIARVLLAVATGGAKTAGRPTDPQSVALVDFAVSPYGKLGQVPDTIALPAVTANTAVISDLQQNVQREVELQGRIIQGFVLQDPPLIASNPQRHAYFGSALAISGDWAIVGAHEASPDGIAHAGSAEVFRVQDDKWLYHQTLIASAKQANAHFGVAVAISGHWAMVGAYEASMPGFDYAGKVEVFSLQDDKWVYHQSLMASDKQANAHFGVAVSLDETWVIVGADTANAGGVAGAGKAYLFELVNDTWAERGPIEASDRQENAGFGSAVALSGGWALVGAYGAGPAALTEAGSVYVFQLTSKGWEAKEPPLAASNQQARAYFGSAVALYDGWALVGADRENVDGAEHAGRVYVFRFDGEHWEERSPPLAPSPIQAHAHFGRAVGLSERWAIVGAERLATQTTHRVGSAYVFQRTNGTWVPTPPLAPDTPQAHVSFSSEVALSMDRVMISAPRENVDGTTQAGRTYIYDSLLTAHLAELERVQADIQSRQRDVGDAAPSLQLVHQARSGLTVYAGVVAVSTVEGTPYLVDGATGAHLWPALLIRRIDKQPLGRSFSTT